MSDRDRADFYRLQARQAQLEMQEVYVLFTSKVSEFTCFKLRFQVFWRSPVDLIWDDLLIIHFFCCDVFVFHIFTSV